MKQEKFDLSLNDTNQLKKLIIENPKLPLLIFCGENSWGQDFAYTQADVNSCSVQSLTLYDDMWLDEECYSERLIWNLADEEEYEGLTDDEFLKMIDKKVEETEFVKAIVIYVG